MFDTTKEDLRDLLRKVAEGKLQLPDFQRDYVWNDSDVRSLMASIAKGYPVGALLTLETGGEVRFKPRLLEGVEVQLTEPGELLLDGQQRCTSLFMATYAQKPVRTRSQQNRVQRLYYFIDIRKALQPNTEFEEAIIAVPQDKILRSDFGRKVEMDLSVRENQYRYSFFPLNQIFDSRNWSYGWVDHWRHDEKAPEIQDLDRRFYREVIEVFERYKMPIIRLDRTNSREAICTVFEKVNVGGKKLDAFELVTAIYAGDSFDLREDWMGSRDTPGRRQRIVESGNRLDVLAELSSTDFLQACTLLHTRETRIEKEIAGVAASELPNISCNRKALLSLPLEAYRRYADAVEEGFRMAGHFLNEQKIIWRKDVPYPPLLVGLASVFAIMKRDAENVAAKQKLARWFWSVTLGEIFGSATDTKLARDVPEMVRSIQGADVRPRSVEDAYFQESRLYSLRTRNSAAYKGIHALLMREGCQDFITGKPSDIMTFFHDDIDIHHIFPKKWCQQNKIDSGTYDAIINKTPLSKRSNIEIGGNAPSKYLKKIEERHSISPETLDDILRSHLIEPKHLRNDDFHAFYEDRKMKLAALIAKAMEKEVVQIPEVQNEMGNEEISDEEVEFFEDQEPFTS